MPVAVPRYNQARELPAAPNQLPSVRQTAAPTADQLGANAQPTKDWIGAGMTSAGRDLFAIGMAMQEKDDADQIMRAEVLLKDAARAKHAEWAQRRGVNATGLTQEAAEWYSTEAAKIGDTLPERVRGVYRQSVERMRGVALDAVSRHEVGERNASLAESAEASIVGSIGFAVENADNPEAPGIAAGEIDKRVTMLAQTLGWTPERTAIERQKYASQLHTRVIDRLVENDPEAAEKYLARHEGSIDPVVVTRLRKGVEASTATRRAQSFADQAMAAGLSEAEAIALAREKLSGEDEIRAVAEVKTRHAEQSAARERAQRDAADAAYAAYAQSNSLNAIPPSVWAAMDGRDQINLKSFHGQRMERIKARNSRDPAVREAAREQERISYQRLREMAEERPEEFAQVDLIAEGAGLSDSDYGKLRTAQEAIRRGEFKGAADVAWKRAVGELGIGGSSERALKERTKLRNAYDAEVNRFRAERGREPTQSERAELIDGLIVSGTVPGVIYGRNDAKRYEAINRGAGKEWRPSDQVADDTAPKTQRESLPRPQTKAERDALPAGTRYIGPDGKQAVKQ